jgi:hypothetical protein
MPHYTVTDMETGSRRYVRARTPAAARKYVLEVDVMTSDEVIDLLQSDRDIQIERADDDAKTEPLPAGTPTAADLELQT